MDKGERILGVDFGLRRVGLAVCDTLWILATPLPALRTSSMRESIDSVASVASREGVRGIVVGLPLNLDGTESVQSGRARAFAKNLAKVTGLAVELFDERLTTVEADELLEKAGVKKSEREKLVDSMAAKVILQGYIDNNKQKTNGRPIMAEQQDENIELIEDEVITLYDENNNPVDFEEVAVVEYDGEFYALLQPVEPMEGLGEDEAIIFKIVQKDEETDEFEPVTDENVLNAVFNEYLKAEAEFADGCDCCDCDCDHDGCDCDHENCDHDHENGECKHEGGECGCERHKKK